VTSSILLPLLIAIAPGIAAWWTGRPIALRATDPALPELLLARQQRLRNVATAALVALVFVSGGSWYWEIPLIGASLVAGGFALRRSLGIATDGLHQQLWRSAKSNVGGLGLWILAASLPAIVIDAGGERGAVVAVVLVIVLLAWEHWYSRVWLWLHNATAITDESLLQRFRIIVDRAGIAAPSVYRIGNPGARFVNAFAFPSDHGAAVGLGNALLELLEPRPARLDAALQELVGTG